MDTVFGTITYLFFAVFFTKIGIHVSLDIASDYKLSLAPAEGLIYFLPYEKEVAPKYEKRKKICNLLQKLSIYLFVLVLISLAVKSFHVGSMQGKKG